MSDIEIHLNPRLTPGHQAVILKYLRAPRGLSKAEWATALPAFDILSSCLVVHDGKSQTFAQFYEEVFDRPYGSALIAELLTLNDVEDEGMRRAGAMARQALAQSSLSTAATTEQQLLAAYCLYWWSAFTKGYVTEIVVFRDLEQSGIIFHAHDLSLVAERFSPDDLTVSGMRGDVKASTYFLLTTRHFPLKHDFYIATLFDPRTRKRPRVVIMQAAAWDRIDGGAEEVELEEAVDRLPQPVAILIKGQRLVVAEYNLWKEKIRALQKRGESHE